jgi:hypothetical protein
LSPATLRMIYFYSIHSIITYNIILRGISISSIKIFRIQQKIIRITINSSSRDSYRYLFKKRKYYLYVHSTYILCHYTSRITNIYRRRKWRFRTLILDTIPVFIHLSLNFTKLCKEPITLEYRFSITSQQTQSV